MTAITLLITSSAHKDGSLVNNSVIRSLAQSETSWYYS